MEKHSVYGDELQKDELPKELRDNLKKEDEYLLDAIDDCDNVKIIDYPVKLTNNQIIIPYNEYDYEESNLQIEIVNSKIKSRVSMLGGNSFKIYEKDDLNGASYIVIFQSSERSVVIYKF